MAKCKFAREFYGSHRKKNPGGTHIHKRTFSLKKEKWTKMKYIIITAQLKTVIQKCQCELLLLPSY